MSSHADDNSLSLLATAAPFLCLAAMVVVLYGCMQVYKRRALRPEHGNFAAYAEKTRLVTEKQGRDAPDLQGIKLAGQDLSRTDLFVVNLNGADLQRTDLREGILYGSTLRGADLRGADLRGAMLDHADLTGARLDGARLDGTKFDPSTRWPAGFPLDQFRGVVHPEPFPSWQTQ